MKKGMRMTTTPRMVCRGCDQELSWSQEGIEHQCTASARMRARHARLSLQWKMAQVAEDIRARQQGVER